MSLLGSIEIEDENPRENVIEFTRDPEPGEQPSRRGRPRGRPASSAEPSLTQVKRMSKSVAEDLAGLFDLGGTLWEFAGDECCAPILQEQSKPLGDAIAACLARNPRLLAKFVDLDVVSLTVLVGAIGKALKPVAVAVWKNHISGAGFDKEGTDGSGGIDFAQFPAYAA